MRAKHLANRESRFTKINRSRQRGNSRSASGNFTMYFAASRSVISGLRPSTVKPLIPCHLSSLTQNAEFAPIPQGSGVRLIYILRILNRKSTVGYPAVKSLDNWNRRVQQIMIFNSAVRSNGGCWWFSMFQKSIRAAIAISRISDRSFFCAGVKATCRPIKLRELAKAVGTILIS